MIVLTTASLTGCKSKRQQSLSSVSSTTQSTYPTQKSTVTVVSQPYCDDGWLPFTLGRGKAKKISATIYDISSKTFYTTSEFFKETSKCEDDQKLGALTGEKINLYHKDALDIDDSRAILWEKRTIEGNLINEMESSYFVNRKDDKEKIYLMLRDFGGNKICYYNRYEGQEYGEGICGNFTYTRN